MRGEGVRVFRKKNSWEESLQSSLRSWCNKVVFCKRNKVEPGRERSVKGNLRETKLHHEYSVSKVRLYGCLFYVLLGRIHFVPGDFSATAHAGQSKMATCVPAMKT